MRDLDSMKRANERETERQIAARRQLIDNAYTWSMMARDSARAGNWEQADAQREMASTELKRAGVYGLPFGKLAARNVAA